MTLDVLGLLGGFVALYFGAEWLVTGATRIAVKLRISKALVGLTLVAFGTSAPELVVNLIAGFQGETDIALSNVSGSNLANLCVGFGLAAVVASPFALPWAKFGRDLTFFFATPLLVVVLLGLGGWTAVPLWGAGVFAVAMAAYLQSVRKKHGISIPDVDDAESVKSGVPLFALGCLCLWAGGELVISRAVSLGEAFGISRTVLGLTVIAIGTSVPDISATVIAARRGESEIAVGNILGSNIFNVVFVLPVTLLAGFKDLACELMTALDYGVGFALAGLIVLVAAARGVLPRGIAVTLLAAYVVYLTARIAML